MHLTRNPHTSVPARARGLRFVAFAVLALTACRTASEPTATRSYGLIAPAPPGATVIVAPDSVRVGASVAIIVNTFGNSSCVAPLSMDVRYVATGVELTPWDRVATETIVCTADIAPRPHGATVTFSAAGPATLSVRGWILDAQGRRALGTVTKSVHVYQDMD